MVESGHDLVTQVSDGLISNSREPFQRSCKQILQIVRHGSILCCFPAACDGDFFDFFDRFYDGFFRLSTAACGQVICGLGAARGAHQHHES